MNEKAGAGTSAVAWGTVRHAIESNAQRQRGVP